MSFKRPKTNDWKQLRPFSHSELSDASAWMQSPTFFQEAGVTASASFLEHWHNGHFILYIEHFFKKPCILKREGEEVTADGTAFFEQ
eukprot:101133-Chlamydomonas_euryale.AAC.1